MTGRPAKPIALLLYDGKKHLGRAEIEERRAAEIHIGTQEFCAPSYVRGDARAYKRWREVIRIFKCHEEARDLVTNADTGAIARYCCTYSEYLHLLEMRNQVADIAPFTLEEKDRINEDFITERGMRGAKRMWSKIEFVMSTYGIMALDKAINAKLAALLQYENHLFLNPLSKIKTVGRKRAEKPKDPLQEAGFGNV